MDEPRAASPQNRFILARSDGGEVVVSVHQKNHPETVDRIEIFFGWTVGIGLETFRRYVRDYRQDRMRGFAQGFSYFTHSGIGHAMLNHHDAHLSFTEDDMEKVAEFVEGYFSANPSV